MKKTLAKAIFACVLLAGMVHGASPNATVQQQIKPLLDELMRAANAHDTDRFLAAYLHRPSLVFVFNGRVITGWENLRDQQLKWWNNGKSDATYSQDGASEFTVLSPNVVVVTNPLASRRTLPGGEVKTSEFVVTMVWQKFPEGWRIVYGHESTVH